MVNIKASIKLNIVIAVLIETERLCFQWTMDKSIGNGHVKRKGDGDGRCVCKTIYEWPANMIITISRPCKSCVGVCMIYTHTPPESTRYHGTSAAIIHASIKSVHVCGRTWQTNKVMILNGPTPIY